MKILIKIARFRDPKAAIFLGRDIGKEGTNFIGMLTLRI
jgi:hypothetical protein